ncbi:MAG TPA: alpha/beta hydrolase [Spirochaetota bacterium]|nr:alpha/beta hydrolase [Spirochaetota bacterium]
MNIENFTFRNMTGLSLLARIYSPDTPSEKGVIFSHGLFSSKDGYKIRKMAEGIVNCGYTLMTFDFTFAGESPGNIADISVLEEVNDLVSAIKFFRGRGITGLHLMGSSMGAAVSLLAAAESDDKFESLILIATPLDLLGIIPGMTPEKVDMLEPDGYTIVQGIKLKNSFFREIKNIDMAGAVRRISSPVILFHGGMDEVVKFSNHEIFMKNIKSDAHPFIIADGDHNLTRESDIEFMLQKISGWLGRFND